MAKHKLGKLPPRYSFILNPYSDIRVSKCTKCRKPTHMRKFALLIHIDGWGLYALGKTCRYCTPCEFIVAHQDELETELVNFFEHHAPDVIGNPYIVLGTIDKQHWKQWLSSGPQPVSEALKHASDFKEVFDLKVKGGWMPMNASRSPKKSDRKHLESR